MCEVCVYEITSDEDLPVPESVAVCPVCEKPLRCSFDGWERDEGEPWEPTESFIEFWHEGEDGPYEPNECMDAWEYETPIRVQAAIHRWAREHVRLRGEP